MTETVTVSKPHRHLFSVASPSVVRPLPVAALAVLTAIAAWRQQGSIAAHDWLPLAVVAALMLATVAVAGVAARPPGALGFAVGSLVLLGGWTALSLTWSPSPAGARDEALLTGLYAIALLLPVVSLARPRHQDGALVLALGVLAGLAVLAALKLALSPNPAGLLFGGRLNFPVSYVNACAALSMLGFWPAVAVAAGRHAPIALRAGATGAGAIFVALAIAAQSKGAVVGFACSAALVLALAPTRLRLLAPAFLCTATATAAAVALTAPYRSDAPSAAHRAGWAALTVWAVATALGGAYAALDLRLTLRQSTNRSIGRAVAVLVAAGAVACVVAVLTAGRSPEAWASEKWTAFKHGPSAQANATHLTSLGSNRYDFWRVALDEAKAHPLRGIGGRGFFSAYLEHRRSFETPLRAHSLYLDVLAETGVPGLALLLVGVGTPLVFLARRLRRPATIGAFGTGAYFLAHAGVDWIWTVPVVGVLAFLIVGIGCAGHAAPSLSRRTAVGAAAAGLVAAVFAFAPPWLAYRYVAAAQHASSSSSDLARARNLDPLSLDPYWAAWRSASDPAARIDALRGALDLEPRSVAVLYQLGLAYRQSGNAAEARTVLQRALRLDPREATIRHALFTISR
jgi:tetratricopeptide (TPR) repeat protein